MVLLIVLFGIAGGGAGKPPPEGALTVTPQGGEAPLTVEVVASGCGMS